MIMVRLSSRNPSCRRSYGKKTAKTDQNCGKKELTRFLGSDLAVTSPVFIIHIIHIAKLVRTAQQLEIKYFNCHGRNYLSFVNSQESFKRSNKCQPHIFNVVYFDKSW